MIRWDWNMFFVVSFNKKLSLTKYKVLVYSNKYN